MSVENTLSQDFVIINIKSTFKPYTNEIWIRNAEKIEEGSDQSEKFWLI